MIDAHCHLDDEQFANDLDAVVARAVHAGVEAIVTAGADVASSHAAVALAERYDGVYAAVGIHPHHAESFDAKALAEIRSLAQHPKVVAIGEIGLDFHYADGAPREAQERNFVAHLDLAQELGKPVVIHDRDAHAEVLDLLVRRNGQPRAMLHCFSGDQAMAQEALALGHFVSFAGNLTFRNARALQETARSIPRDRVLIETDAPYLSPRRGRRNEPANVALVARKLAELLELDPSAIAGATRDNSESLFGLRTAKARRL